VARLLLKLLFSILLLAAAAEQLSTWTRVDDGGVVRVDDTSESEGSNQITKLMTRWLVLLLLAASCAEQLSTWTGGEDSEGSVVVSE
jgi:hypothetical protein